MKDPRYDDGLEEVIQEARDAGVQVLCANGTHEADWDKVHTRNPFKEMWPLTQRSSHFIIEDTQSIRSFTIKRNLENLGSQSLHCVPKGSVPSGHIARVG